MRCTRVGRSWNRNRGEGFVLDSHGAAGRGAGGPSPLKVEAAEPAGDIHDFTNKEETGNFAGFQGFAVKFIGVHTAGSDFGYFITFGSCRCDDPFVNLRLESFERLIRPIGWSVEIEPARGKTVSLSELSGLPKVNCESMLGTLVQTCQTLVARYDERVSMWRGAHRRTRTDEPAARRTVEQIKPWAQMTPFQHGRLLAQWQILEQEAYSDLPYDASNARDQKDRS